MAYFITFRVAQKTVGSKTYEERRQSIVDAAYTSQGYWDETTSFIIAESNLDTNGYCAKISRGLSAADDILVVFDPSDMSSAYFGPVKHPDVLGSFFRTLKKLP